MPGGQHGPVVPQPNRDGIAQAGRTPWLCSVQDAASPLP